MRPEGFEPPTPWFEAKCSIQMSYGRNEEGVTSGLHPPTPILLVQSVEAQLIENGVKISVCGTGNVTQPNEGG